MSANSGEKKVPPPGLELLFAHNYPKECKSPFNAMVLAVHWSTVSTTSLRLQSNSTPTELLPDNWPSLISDNDASSRYIPLMYKNPISGRNVTVKVQELAVDGVVAVMAEPENEKARAITFDTDQYVDCSAVKNGSTNVYEVYRVDKLWELRRTFKDKLLGDEEEPKEKGDGEEVDSNPYTSNLTKSQKEAIEREKERQKRERERPDTEDPYNDPLRPSRIIQPPGIPRGIGSSDLDPFSIMTPGSGMLMDPRGFRGPRLPQGIPPARFDPFGPPGSGQFGPRGGFPGGGFGGAPRLPFGFPDPDHERPHGFDDMFS